MKGRKVLLTLACAVLLVAASVMGTLAYLTSDDTVTNTFTVGQVKIKLDEAKANEDGSLVDGAERVKGNKYKLLPGHTYHKDPMVTVLKGSEESYIRMTVTVSKSKELDAIFSPDGAKLLTIFTGYDKSNWIYKGSTKDEKANTRTYEFWYKEAVGAPDTDVALDALFDQIKVPDEITNEQLATLYTTDKDGKVTDQLTITVKACAIQKDGFGTPEAAWEKYPAD